MISGTLLSTTCFRLTSFLILALACIPEATGQVRLTKDEALGRFFPGSVAGRETLFLSEEQQAWVRARAKTSVESRIITYYVARKEQSIEGYAFLETNTVRTMPETFMVLIRPDSTVGGIEILAFHEPADYLPGARWLSIFLGRSLSDDLWVKRSIPNITGATLSSQAITKGVRKALALFELVEAKEARQ